MRIKNLVKTITAAREGKIVDTSGGIAVLFGDRDSFDLLRIEIIREKSGQKWVYSIKPQFLPCNKSNSTRFRITSQGDDISIVWCRKVAQNMIKEQ